MATKTEAISWMKRYSLIQGSPESTYGKKMHDGSLETYGDIAKKSRKEINYHSINGETIGSIVRTNVAGVIGEKVIIQSRSKSKTINEAFEELLSFHKHRDNFDVTGKSHREEGWRQSVAALTLQGGIIVRHHYNTAWTIPYRLEFVGIDMIDTSKNDKQDNLQNGLKKDRYGRVVGIYLYDSEDKTSSTIHGMDDMDYVVFAWVSLSQYTAISRFVTILQTLDATSQYTASEVKSAMNRANNSVYHHTELYDILQKAFEKEFGSNSSELLLEAKEILDSMEERGFGNAGVKTTPVGDSITQLDSKTDSVYEAINSQAQMKASASMGQSQVTAFRNIKDGNYSSIKAAFSMDQGEFKIVFNNMQEYIIGEYARRLFKVGVEIGYIKIPLVRFYATPFSHLKYMKFEILRTSRLTLNEKDDATATKTNLESGVTTLSLEYSIRGKDYLEEMERDTDVEIQVELMRIEKWEKAGIARPIKKDDVVIDAIIQEEEIDNEK